MERKNYDGLQGPGEKAAAQPLKSQGVGDRRHEPFQRVYPADRKAA